MINKKVFLGGTCNNSDWRERLIPKLNIDFFNPVVDDWTEECMEEEIRQREICDYCLYTITPKMMGVYSIAEVIDDSNKRPGKTIFCLLEEDTVKCSFNIKFDSSEYRSLNAVGKMVSRNGGKYFNNLDDVANYLNSEHDNSLSLKEVVNLPFGTKLHRDDSDWTYVMEQELKIINRGKESGVDYPSITDDICNAKFTVIK